MKSGKLGLVLAGGGGKGAYHIGVWRALREYGVEQNIQAISGTSVGALNGALFALGDYELAESIWRGLTYDKVLSLSKNRILALLLGAGLGSWMAPEFISLMAGAGVFTRQGLQEIIERKLLQSEMLQYLIGRKPHGFQRIGKRSVQIKHTGLQHDVFSFPEFLRSIPSFFASWIRRAAGSPTTLL